MLRLILRLGWVGVCLGLCSAGAQDFTYRILGAGFYRSIEITGCPQSTSGIVVVPERVEDLPVTSIGISAFVSCGSLTGIVLPQGITAIESWAFRRCTSLREMVFPAGVTKIGNGAFSECASLEHITLPEGITSLGFSSFSACSSLASVAFPPGLATIPSSAFSHCGALTTLTLPAGATSIGSLAFMGCSNLTCVNFPAGLRNIGTMAFFETGLTAVALPASVTGLYYDSFGNCPDLREIDVPEGNPVYSDLDGVLFNKNRTELIYHPKGKPGDTYHIPGGVRSIGFGAFAHCSGLGTIHFPSSLTSVGDYAFSRCSGLSGVSIPSTVRGVGASAFSNCTGIAVVTFGDGLVSIGAEAFAGCAKLDRVIFTGHAPLLGEAVFPGGNPGFSVYYMAGSQGFVSPVWNGYPAVPIDEVEFPAGVWLLENGFAYDTDPAMDVNGDGVSLLLACALNLDPHLCLTGLLPAAELREGSMVILFPASARNVGYQVQTSVDLRHWTTEGVTQPPPDQNGRILAAVAQESSTRYLRIIIRLQPPASASVFPQVRAPGS